MPFALCDVVIELNRCLESRESPAVFQPGTFHGLVALNMGASEVTMVVQPITNASMQGSSRDRGEYSRAAEETEHVAELRKCLNALRTAMRTTRPCISRGIASVESKNLT